VVEIVQCHVKFDAMPSVSATEYMARIKLYENVNSVNIIYHFINTYKQLYIVKIVFPTLRYIQWPLCLSDV